MEHFSAVNEQGILVRVAIEPDLSLAQHLFQSGLFVDRALCSGIGRCGLCRVVYESDPPPPGEDELRVLGPDEVRRGTRLSCRHNPLPQDRISVPGVRSEKGAALQTNPGSQIVDLAVDLGTTSVKWAALCHGRWCAQGHFPNPQLGAGSEIMSRLAYARRSERHAARLRDAVRERLLHLIEHMQVSVGSMCVTGNTAMVSILFGKPLHGMCSAPYRLVYRGDSEEILDRRLPRIYVPPVLGPFIGADISSGLTWLIKEGRVEFPFLLADLGTNGELVLALSPKRFIAASVPLGPALEGCGLSSGTMAEQGAVTGFRLSEKGLEPMGAVSPSGWTGITATGYVSLAAHLLRSGVLDIHGRFQDGSTPLSSRLSTMVQSVRGEPQFRVGEGLAMAGADVEELLKIKAAFNTALESLLAAADLDLGGVSRICVAGALGEHFKPDHLTELGFFPQGVETSIQSVGNTSLKGAAALLGKNEYRDLARRLADTTTVLDLTEQAEFGTEFVRRMVFHYL